MALGGKVLFGTAVAALVGASSAAAGAYYVETSMAAPKFTTTGERYDTATFMGRYAKMLSNGDPGTLLASDEDVRSAQQMLDKYKAGKLYKKDYGIPTDAELNDKLWAARKLKESAVHPDTGEIIPRPFRMAGYVPYNGPVCAAMMISSSTPMLLLWNWVNQSQNALVNYFNRNASSETSTETLAMSYAAAVGAALTVAFGLSTVVKRTASPETAKRLMTFVAFPASMVASCSNCYIMRRPETQVGIDLVDKDGNKLSKKLTSKIAATKAVQETVISRALLQFPVFFVPALFMILPPVAKISKKPIVGIPLMTLVTMISFAYGLPATVAVFPQIGTIAKKDLEIELQQFVKGDVAYYSKGL